MKSRTGPWVRVQLIREKVTVDRIKVQSSGDVYALLKEGAQSWDREHLVTIMLDTDQCVIGIEEVAVGSLTIAPIVPRELFKGLILANAEAFILLHNHQGDRRPSSVDIEMTKQLKTASELLGFRFHDHIIIGRDGYTSFLDDGYW